MTPIRTLQQETARVETGPIRFGDDWPGLFIRGDDCAYYKLILDNLLRVTTLDLVTKIELEGLKQLLSGAFIHG